jgi:hypothetical protein
MASPSGWLRERLAVAATKGKKSDFWAGCYGGTYREIRPQSSLPRGWPGRALRAAAGLALINELFTMKERFSERHAVSEVVPLSAP